MPTPQKTKQVAEMRAIAEENSAAFMIGYRGLPVARMQTLREKVADAGGTVRVVKNTLFRLAVKDTELEKACELLDGPTAIVYGGEPPAVAKALDEFAEKNDKLVIYGGVMEGQLLTAEAVKAVSKIPPREVLYSLLVAGLEGPISGLVNTLKGTISKLVYALDEIKDKKEAA